MAQVFKAIATEYIEYTDSPRAKQISRSDSELGAVEVLDETERKQRQITFDTNRKPLITFILKSTKTFLSVGTHRQRLL